MKVPEAARAPIIYQQELTGASKDGIHVDMDRLKKGEVKYVSNER